MKKELSTIEDIQFMVNEFYSKIREDVLLGPIFNRIIANRWPEHLEKMYRFWQTVLLEEHTYFGSPFPPHAKLPVEQKHFDQWLLLFKEVVETHFTGAKAKEVIWRAEKMAAMFVYKIEHLKNNPDTIFPIH
jgi:hemoglobin